MTFNLTRVAWIVFLVLTIESLFSVPLLSWELALGGRHQLAGVGFGLSAAGGIGLFIWRWRATWKNFLESGVARFSKISVGQWLSICFALGVLLRLLWAWQYPSPQRSDQATYFSLARGLVESHQYGFPDGGLAYWPPGFPLFLAAWFAIFGSKPWVPLLANICLFGGTLVVVERLARRIGGTPASRLATLLLVPWPTMVMIAAFSGKELLVVFLLCLVLLSFTHALESTARGAQFAWVGLTGLLLGAMSLTQPSFLLFVFVLALYDYMCSRYLLRAAVRSVVTVVALCAVILPWTVRNHRVLGAWIPVSTNGGDVFYRANNPLATGGYTARGEQSLDSLDELSRGKVGFRLGVEWIRSHPATFLSLAFRKQILFLGDDAQGAYETLKRGLGIDGIRYALWKALSNMYWWGLWALILLMMATRWKSSFSQNTLLGALLLSVIYLIAIHSVFESGGKYHEPLMGLVAVLAAQVVASSSVPGASARP
jgi:4-amino-4-deoxy-L-arabinose transferase-like glycosyltransferase